MKLEIIGLGYIGLPTALLFASRGMDVVGIDVDTTKIEKINRGEIQTDEPGLKELLKNCLVQKRFKAQQQIETADAYIIAVPTPNKKDRYHSCDSSYVEDVVRKLVPLLKKGDTIIVESTIAPQVMAKKIVPLLEASALAIGSDIFLAYCPERVLPGNIIEEISQNPRIIGGQTQACSERAMKLYELIVKGPLHQATAAEAEMIKLVENTYRDLNIAYGNELVKICHQLGIDVYNVIELANKHPRVMVHQPGPGVGGHCLAVDPYFIVASAPEESPLIQLGREINKSMPSFVVERVLELMVAAPTNKITVFGLAYKGNVDDMRESPSHDIIKELTAKGFDVSSYDPYIEGYRESSLASCEESSLLMVLTDHRQFSQLTESHTSLMAKKQVFDTKNCVKSVPKNVSYYHFGKLKKG